MRAKILCGSCQVSSYRCNAISKMNASSHLATATGWSELCVTHRTGRLEPHSLRKNTRNFFIRDLAEVAVVGGGQISGAYRRRTGGPPSFAENWN
jgi:hypothetical protein